MWWYDFLNYWDSEEGMRKIHCFWLVVISIEICTLTVIMVYMKYFKQVIKLTHRFTRHKCSKQKTHIWTTRTIGRHCKRCRMTYKDYLNNSPYPESK